MEEVLNVQNPKLLSPLSLAFVGDAVYELMVRESLLHNGSMPVGKLHSLAVAQVRASYQSKGYEVLLDIVTAEELDILKRGRNASSAKVPKNADLVEYRRATGVEALFGYLHLKGQKERLTTLFLAIQEMVQK